MTEPRVRSGCEPFRFHAGPVGVLMVHGFTGSPASMRPVGEWLAGRGLSVVGVRLPGHGTDLDDLRARRWTEWVEGAAAGLEVLRERCRTVVAFGQSMGGSVVLATAASHPRGVDGIALANPYVFDVRLRLLPAARRFVRNLKGIANDIAKPGEDENADEAMPVEAVAEMAAMMRVVRASLPSLRQPVLIFRSGADHVIPRSNAERVLARIGSDRKELIACPRSYHVVTLDHDAPLVRERLLAFANDLDVGQGD